MESRNPNSTLSPSREDRIKLNVGGKVFETTVSTLRSGGPDSLLAALSSHNHQTNNPIFIDRDPEIFSVLLSLLRSHRLPSSASRRFSKQELADEALYYGVENRLRSAMSPPPFSAIDASIVSTIRPASDAFASSFTAADGGPNVDASLWIAHGGQISAYDWNLTRVGTIRTHLEHITSIRRVWSEVAAVGSTSSAGVHFYDIAGGRHIGSAHWTDPSDPRIYKARVTAVADSVSSVFAACECHHRENCVLTVDKETLQIVAEIGRQSGHSTKAVVPGKLMFLPETGVLAGSAVMSGAFGYAGYIRLWDPRSGDVVWETNEPGSGRSSRFGDSFADVDVDVDGSKLFKVCSKSGDVAGADLRKLGEDPWVYLKEKNPSLRNTGGGNSNNLVIRCYKKQVFVGRDGGLEVWSRVVGREEAEEREGMMEEREGMMEEREAGLVSLDEGSYRRNHVDNVRDGERGIIKRIEGGGNRLFVSRENVEGIEVWETSHQSGEVILL